MTDSCSLLTARGSTQSRMKKQRLVAKMLVAVSNFKFMDEISTNQEIKRRQEKGAEPEVLTPRQTPSWTFGLTTVFVFVVLPLLIIAGFYFGVLNNL